MIDLSLHSSVSGELILSDYSCAFVCMVKLFSQDTRDDLVKTMVSPKITECESDTISYVHHNSKMNIKNTHTHSV